MAEAGSPMSENPDTEGEPDPEDSQVNPDLEDHTSQASQNLPYEEPKPSKSAPKEEPKLSQKSPKDGSGSSQKSPDEGSGIDRFFSETKYVVLNFMSLLPPDLYSNHLSSSPESAVSDLLVGDNLDNQYHPLGSHYRSQHQLTKSKSFDISPQRRIPKLKHLSHLSALQNVESPASEDNLNYRYKQYLHSLDQPRSDIPDECNDINCTPDTCGHFDKVMSQSTHSFKSESPGSVSPRKTPHGLARWCSDISSSGDFSYASDADDEGEDLSNASSTFSMKSARLREGFLDLRKPSPRFTPLAKQPEPEFDDVDGLFHHMPPVEEEDTKLDIENNDNKEIQSMDQRNDESDPNHTGTPSPRHSKGSFPSRSHAHPHALGHGHHLHRSHPVAGSSQDQDKEDHGVSSDKKIADRSNLKLDIPSQVVQLDDILVSLQTDLNNEITDLESEFEEALRSSSSASGRRHTGIATPLTPQTEAARILARIGDEVRDQYGNQITAAVNEVMLHQLQELTYTKFKEISKAVIDENLPGWRQVALLMVFGQKMVWKALEKGQKQFGSLVDFSAQLVADVAADFIIREGGWGAIMNFDPSQSSDSQSSALEDQPSPSIIDYFNSHEVTQVDSGDLKNGEPDVGSFSSGTNVDTGQKSRDQNYTETGQVSKEKDDANRKSDRQESFEVSDIGQVGGSENGLVVDKDFETVTDTESTDGVFNENTNENAKISDDVSDQHRLNVSGRELYPSIGFEYKPGISLSMSEVPSAGMEYSHTEGVKDVFNFDDDSNQNNSGDKMDETNETVEKQNTQNGVGANVSAFDSSVDVIEPEITAMATVNTATHVDNHSSTDNQTFQESHNIGNVTSTADQNKTETDNQVGKISHDTISHTSDIISSAGDTGRATSDTVSVVGDTVNSADTPHSGNASREESHWYSDYRRLGYGAAGLSLGVLALALSIRQIK